jgi:hypothetical protein
MGVEEAFLAGIAQAREQVQHAVHPGGRQAVHGSGTGGLVRSVGRAGGCVRVRRG